MPSYIALRLGKLMRGCYQFKTGNSEDITELYVVDGEGVKYASVSSPGGSASLEFDVENDPTTGSSLIAVTEKQVNITYAATRTNLSSASPSPSPSSAETLHKSCTMTFAFFVGFASAFIWL
ncbi:uncharacterized protein P174DRAFT_434374 [Aspergillus novofumigatus IBT 16806]|uniref:Uncharacterized protein n=1 Tax=Aspergillus novofumigatus (strain IBT 16806) TaxID=1392255 RepID=A0A2I1BX37_ASPN1|nr:uncharacterized protein P174DRAFT_434374 [Aspergillus novofumigatus IBT 16806]PKX89940.1 hypothetical protein P174DRAFT_434374 [Aspergillus novofumigatus IBT 16806]